MSILIDFTYTGQVTIDVFNVNDLIMAADLLSFISLRFGEISTWYVMLRALFSTAEVETLSDLVGQTLSSIVRWLHWECRGVQCAPLLHCRSRPTDLVQKCTLSSLLWCGSTGVYRDKLPFLNCRGGSSERFRGVQCTLFLSARCSEPLIY